MRRSTSISSVVGGNLSGFLIMEPPVFAELSLLTKEDVAGAIHRAFEVSHPMSFIDDFTLADTVTIDGAFHLEAVAAVLLIKVHDLAAQALAPLPETQRRTL
jgi:hypothetical protein